MAKRNAVEGGALHVTQRESLVYSTAITAHIVWDSSRAKVKKSGQSLG